MRNIRVNIRGTPWQCQNLAEVQEIVYKLLFSELNSHFGQVFVWWVNTGAMLVLPGKVMKIRSWEENKGKMRGFCRSLNAAPGFGKVLIYVNSNTLHANNSRSDGTAGPWRHHTNKSFQYHLDGPHWLLQKELHKLKTTNQMNTNRTCAN